MIKKYWLATLASCGLLTSGITLAACPFNVSGDAAIDSLRDGLLLVRYAQGLRGAALVAGTTANTPAVENFIVANTAGLDVNGNGVFDIGDAAIIARSVFGFSYQAWMPDGQAGAYATRTSPALVKTFVDAGCTAPVFVSPTTTDAADASRFLIQSTFGPSRSDIAAFLALGANQSARSNAWIASQLTTPRSGSHFQYLVNRKSEYVAGGALDYTFGNNITRESFWGQALTSPDQLRQRLGLALSEVLVVSEYGGSNDPYELAAYLDLLADNAFTNYRDLLYKVALSPAMGRYLSHLRNEADLHEQALREAIEIGRHSGEHRSSHLAEAS